MQNTVMITDEDLTIVSNGSCSRTGRYRYSITYVDKAGTIHHEYTDVYSTLDKANEVLNSRIDALEKMGCSNFSFSRTI